MSTPPQIYQRRSISRLIEPGPTPEQMNEMLTAAAAAPDHGQLRPWRFIVLEGDARLALGEVLVESAQHRAQKGGKTLTPGQYSKERTKLTRAPTVVITACVPAPGPIPEVEQVAAVAAATQNMLISATAQGIGSMWRTGEASRDATVKRSLGLAADDTIIGFVYLGTIPEGAAKVANRPDVSDAVSWGLPS